MELGLDQPNFTRYAASAEIPTGLLRFVLLVRDLLALFAVPLDIKPLEPIGDGTVSK